VANGRNIAERSSREAKEDGRAALLSRLSRDLGNTWQIVFRDLATAHVRVIDVSTGMASDSAGARIQFGALALVNDTMLQSRPERDAARARGPRAGRLLGRRPGLRVQDGPRGEPARPRTSPGDRTRPTPNIPGRYRSVDEIQAAVVRRMFQLYGDSYGLRQIASLVNEEGVPAPYDGAYRKQGGRGWGPGTIRFILKNERYVWPLRLGRSGCG
jgi:DNA invertase Pin-like site-specific DNA recombinase